MEASYRFAMRFRVNPQEGVRLDPAEFDTTLRYEAPRPGADGWLFFRDHLWRGEVNDHEHARRLISEAISVPVVAVEFRAFETDQDYLDTLRETIAQELATFRAETVDEVLTKYLGSAVEVNHNRSPK